MFAVIYRINVLADREQNYQKLWHKLATYFVNERGAIGSCLHKSYQGYWVAYSRWPDRATRDASWPGDDAPSDELPDEIKKVMQEMKSCVDESNKMPEITMDVVDDLLVG